MRSIHNQYVYHIFEYIISLEKKKHYSKKKNLSSFIGVEILHITRILGKKVTHIIPAFLQNLTRGRLWQDCCFVIMFLPVV